MSGGSSPGATLTARIPGPACAGARARALLSSRSSGSPDIGHRSPSSAVARPRRQRDIAGLRAAPPPAPGLRRRRRAAGARREPRSRRWERWGGTAALTWARRTVPGAGASAGAAAVSELRLPPPPAAACDTPPAPAERSRSAPRPVRPRPPPRSGPVGSGTPGPPRLPPARSGTG